MNFEELQREWQAMESEPRSHDELRKMMYASPASHLRRIPRKEILRFVIVALGLVAIMLAFDMFESWSTGLPMSVAFFELLDEHLGLRYMRLTPQRATVQKTLEAVLARMKRVVLLSRLAHAAVWIAAVVIIAIKMQLGFVNIVFLMLATLPVLLAVNWLTSRRWSRKLDEVKALLRELDGEIATGNL